MASSRDATGLRVTRPGSLMSLAEHFGNESHRIQARAIELLEKAKVRSRVRMCTCACSHTCCPEPAWMLATIRDTIAAPDSPSGRSAEHVRQPATRHAASAARAVRLLLLAAALAAAAIPFLNRGLPFCRSSQSASGSTTPLSSLSRMRSTSAIRRGRLLERAVALSPAR